MPISYYGLVAPKRHLKEVKTRLEGRGLFDKRRGIYIHGINSQYESRDDLWLVPTTLATDSEPETPTDALIPVEETGFPSQLVGCITDLEGVNHYVLINSQDADGIGATQAELRARAAGKLHPLEDSLRKAISTTRQSCHGLITTSVDALLQNCPKKYSCYPPMLLLPQEIERLAEWHDLLAMLQTDVAAWDAFFSTLARNMQSTHVAMDAPVLATIPPGIETRVSSDSKRNLDGADLALGYPNSTNVLRSPISFRPLYGDFGQPLPAFPQHRPNDGDFKEAFWVSTKQNQIHQVWAPRYTMFSSGNVTEKARVLNLTNLPKNSNESGIQGEDMTAVDFFAGIGYFAFSYKKAGVKNVLCWDLNPWSVEGLRRGSLKNKWSVSVMAGPSLDDIQQSLETTWEKGAPDLLVFCESNEFASQRLTFLRDKLGPIRHVNAGMLPSACQAWETAIKALDSRYDGWLHLHEVVQEAEVQQRAASICHTLQETYNDLLCSATAPPSLVVQHLEKVKSIGPRKLHIVLDILVPARELL